MMGHKSSYQDIRLIWKVSPVWVMTGNEVTIFEPATIRPVIRMEDIYGSKLGHPRLCRPKYSLTCSRYSAGPGTQVQFLASLLRVSYYKGENPPAVAKFHHWGLNILWSFLLWSFLTILKTCLKTTT